MRIKGWALGLVFFAAVAVSGCARTDDPAPHGGETNWLHTCKGDVDCAAGSCVCGLCSTACEGSSDCTGDFEGSCVSADSRIGASVCNSTKGWVPALCLPVCTGDEACGAGFVCRDGACVTLEHAFDFDTAGMTADAGDPPVVPSDAGLGTDAEAASCTLADPECNAAENPICALDTATSRFVPECYTPFESEFYAVRCGAYDGIVDQGIDSRTTYFYDAKGALVARNDQGLSAIGCMAYDPTFTLEPCEMVTPMCPDPQAPCDCAAEVQSLACVCSFMDCPTFEQARNLAPCNGPEPSMISGGCGYAFVWLHAGSSSTTLVYRGDERTLVGASFTDDVPVGECGRSAYRTALPDIKECADFSACTLCASAGAGLCER